MHRIDHSDDSPLVHADGRPRGRVLAPANRPGGVVTRIPGGAAPWMEFTSVPGDTTAEDAKHYAAGAAPTRSFITFEDDGSLRRFGVPVEASVEIMVPSKMEDGTPIPAVSENLFHVFLQWNVWKDAKELKRSPPIELAFRAVDIPAVDRLGRKTVKKDATGRPIKEERFTVAGRHLAAPSKTSKGTTLDLGSAPMVRDRWHGLRVRFVDNRGQDGELAVWIDGVQVTDYRGPLFYAAEGTGYAGGYLGAGTYRHNGTKTPFAIHMRNLKEGLAA